jgi:hypothetical protein
MAWARVAGPGLPHHVTQRGNGRAQTSLDHGDSALKERMRGPSPPPWLPAGPDDRRQRMTSAPRSARSDQSWARIGAGLYFAFCS